MQTLYGLKCNFQNRRFIHPLCIAWMEESFWGFFYPPPFSLQAEKKKPNNYNLWQTYMQDKIKVILQVVFFSNNKHVIFTCSVQQFCTEQPLSSFFGAPAGSPGSCPLPSIASLLLRWYSSRLAFEPCHCEQTLFTHKHTQARPPLSA